MGPDDGRASCTIFCDAGAHSRLPLRGFIGCRSLLRGCGTECSTPHQNLGGSGKSCYHRRPEEIGGEWEMALEYILKIFLCPPVLGRSLGVLPTLRLSVAQASSYVAYWNTCGVSTASQQSWSPAPPDLLVGGSLLLRGPAFQIWDHAEHAHLLRFHVKRAAYTEVLTTARKKHHYQQQNNSYWTCFSARSDECGLG